MTVRQPSLFIPHGGGPCFFIPDPAGHWTGLGIFLRSLPGLLVEQPAAILVVSAHWETKGFRITSGSGRPLILTTTGFLPKHTNCDTTLPERLRSPRRRSICCEATGCRSRSIPYGASTMGSSCQ